MLERLWGFKLKSTSKIEPFNTMQNDRNGCVRACCVTFVWPYVVVMCFASRAEALPLNREAPLTVPSGLSERLTPAMCSSPVLQHEHKTPNSSEVRSNLRSGDAVSLRAGNWDDEGPPEVRSCHDTSVCHLWGPEQLPEGYKHRLCSLRRPVVADTV